MSRAPHAGFFTLGVSPDRYQLPHRRLGLPVVLMIRRVLCRAFELLFETHNSLASAQEDQITAALLAIIENDLRQTGSVRGFDRHTYEAVNRQAQVANYSGARLAKTPDLRFKLRQDEMEPRGLSEYDALFVECKPVDASHAVGGNYCDGGLIRFVRGDYAWAMQEGMMLAYARDGRTIAGHLIPAMSGPKRMASLAVAQLPQPCLHRDAAGSSRAETIHLSQHCRAFPWPDEKGQATDITIYHLWHDCG
jgi:hypothetical protein